MIEFRFKLTNRVFVKVDEFMHIFLRKLSLSESIKDSTPAIYWESRFDSQEEHLRVQEIPLTLKNQNSLIYAQKCSQSKLKTLRLSLKSTKFYLMSYIRLKNLFHYYWQ
jgi:hypothetical protein